MNIVLEDKLYLDPTEDMNSVTKKSLEKLMLEIFAELEKSENESLYLNMNFGELYENFNRIFVANDSIKQCATTLLTLILEEGTGLNPEEILRKCKDVPYYFCLRRKDLTSINIPSNIKTIYGCAFDHCQSLTNINIENGVKSIGSFAFNDTGIEHVVIPDSVTYMGGFCLCILS